MQTEIDSPGKPGEPSASEDAGKAEADSVPGLVRAVCRGFPFRTPVIENIEARLDALLERLAGGQLQIAVVCQFKRGKSTLLNALLGRHLLPSAITPLTAIPTFLVGAAGWG